MSDEESPSQDAPQPAPLQPPDLSAVLVGLVLVAGALVVLAIASVAAVAVYDATANPCIERGEWFWDSLNGTTHSTRCMARMWPQVHVVTLPEPASVALAAAAFVLVWVPFVALLARLRGGNP